MRVLLVSPCYLYPRRRYELSGSGGLIAPPLGLGYIAAVLQRARIEVSIIDMLLDDLRPQDVVSSLEHYRPDVVGISCNMAFVYWSALEIARCIKAFDSRIITVMGGNHATYEYTHILRAAQAVDYVVRFEGEYSMSRLLGALAAGGDASRCPGVAGRGPDGHVWLGPRPTPIRRLDQLPLPARDLVEMKRYDNDSRGVMITSRGCPYSCAYCSTSTFNGRHVRCRGVGHVVDEMEELVQRYSVRHVMFVDDTLTASAHRVRQLCAEIVRRDLDVTWACDTRVDLVNPSLLEHMRSAGCTYSSGLKRRRSSP